MGEITHAGARSIGVSVRIVNRISGPFGRICSRPCTLGAEVDGPIGSVVSP